MTKYITDWLVVSVENGNLFVNGVEVLELHRETWNNSGLAKAWIDSGLSDIWGWLRVEYRPEGKVVKFYTDEEMKNAVDAS